MSEGEELKNEENLTDNDAAQLPDDVALCEGDDLASLVEALLFASSEPLGAEQLAEICRVKIEEIDEAIAKLKSKYDGSVSGFELCQVASQFQLRTDARFAPFIRVMRAGRPRRLSHAALETLAVIAYRQPVVRSDIEKIRGVDVTPTLKTLIDRHLVRIVGHQSTVGQPALYGTTEEFLKLFGLNSLSELPTLRDIKELERDPGEPTSEESSSEVSNNGGDHESMVANFAGDIPQNGGEPNSGGDNGAGGNAGGDGSNGEKASALAE